MRTAQGMDEEDDEELVLLTEAVGGVARRGRQTSSSSTCVLNSELTCVALQVKKLSCSLRKAPKSEESLTSVLYFAIGRQRIFILPKPVQTV